MSQHQPLRQLSAVAVQMNSDDELIDEAGRESFPASDPPAHSLSDQRDQRSRPPLPESESRTSKSTTKADG